MTWLTSPGGKNPALVVMTKRDLKMLERIFEAEIYGRLPSQSKSNHLLELQEVGLVEPMTRTFGRDRFGVIEVTGWALTLAGNFAYCDSCKDVEVPE